jgi:phosphopantetheinyl transferase (holo-ACP synthase)
VVAISNSKSLPVGADIEDIDKRNMIATRFLTESEKKLLENGTPYLKIWTKKEALFKYLKNDSTPFIKLDSTTPEIYGAQFTTMKIEDSILTICAKETDKIELIQK